MQSMYPSREGNGLLIPTVDHLEVDWMQGYANMPRLIVWTVEDPWGTGAYSKWVHELKDDRGLWLAVQEPWAHFVMDRSETGPSGGALTGDLLTTEGIRRVTSGWSSGSYYVNSLLPEDEHLMDVTLQSEATRYLVGMAGMAIQLKAIKPLISDMGLYIVRGSNIGDGTDYNVSIDPDKVVKP